MGRQSARIVKRETGVIRDHKDIIYGGYHHDALYHGNQLVWEKLKDVCPDLPFMPYMVCGDYTDRMLFYRYDIQSGQTEYSLVEFREDFTEYEEERCLPGNMIAQYGAIWSVGGMYFSITQKDTGYKKRTLCWSEDGRHWKKLPLYEYGGSSWMLAGSYDWFYNYNPAACSMIISCPGSVGYTQFCFEKESWSDCRIDIAWDFAGTQDDVGDYVYLYGPRVDGYYPEIFRHWNEKYYFVTHKYKEILEEITEDGGRHYRNELVCKGLFCGEDLSDSATWHYIPGTDWMAVSREDSDIQALISLNSREAGDCLYIVYQDMLYRLSKDNTIISYDLQDAGIGTILANDKPQGTLYELYVGARNFYIYKDRYAVFFFNKYIITYDMQTGTALRDSRTYASYWRATGNIPLLEKEDGLYVVEFVYDRQAAANKITMTKIETGEE